MAQGMEKYDEMKEYLKNALVLFKENQGANHNALDELTSLKNKVTMENLAVLKDGETVPNELLEKVEQKSGKKLVLVKGKVKK